MPLLQGMCVCECASNSDIVLSHNPLPCLPLLTQDDGGSSLEPFVQHVVDMHTQKKDSGVCPVCAAYACSDAERTKAHPVLVEHIAVTTIAAPT